MLTARANTAPRRWLTACAGIAACLAQARSAGSADFDAELEVSAYADTDHVEVLTPAISGTLSDARSGVSATGGYVVDIVSGASVDIVSTASERWVEVRQAADLSVDLEQGDAGLTVSGSVSREPDYLSWSVGAMARLELDANHVTPSLGYSFSHDTAGRSGTPYSVYALRLARHVAQAGVELVIDRSSRLMLLAEAAFESGRQEKPYRFLPLFNQQDAARLEPGASVESVNAVRLPGRIAERVPESRRRFTLTGDWARRGAQQTLRVNERLYADSWGLFASTSDVSWLWDASSRLTLVPRARLHVQSSVNFWQRAYVGAVDAGELSVPALRSGDRELSALWTGALGFGSEWRTQPTYGQGWTFGALLDVGFTNFFDALFIEQRSSALAALTAERAF
jgi:hypothetical protein